MFREEGSTGQDNKKAEKYGKKVNMVKMVKMVKTIIVISTASMTMTIKIIVMIARDVPERRI